MKMGNFSSNASQPPKDSKEANESVESSVESDYKSCDEGPSGSNINRDCFHVEEKILALLSIARNASLTSSHFDIPRFVKSDHQPVQSTSKSMPNLRSTKNKGDGLPDEELSQNTIEKVNEIIKCLPGNPSPYQTESDTFSDLSELCSERELGLISDLDTGTDSDSFSDSDSNSKFDKLARVVLPTFDKDEIEELTVPRTQKLDKDGEPVNEKCTCSHHQAVMR